MNMHLVLQWVLVAVCGITFRETTVCVFVVIMQHVTRVWLIDVF